MNGDPNGCIVFVMRSAFYTHFENIYTKQLKFIHIMEHSNKLIVSILREEFADYDNNSWHYDSQYKMIEKALFKACEMKIYRVEFEGIYPIGNCLVLAAYNQQQAEEITRKTLPTDKFVVNELVMSEPQVIEYMSGDY